MLKNFLIVSLALIAISVACSGPSSSPSPTSPSTAVSAGTTGADSDAVTLKASAPTPTSPLNNVKVDSVRPTLTITNATGTYVTATFVHRFQVIDSSGAVVVDSGLVSPSGNTTSYTLTTDLAADKTFTWRARAEDNGRVGPWSSTASASFITPNLKGYVLGSEIYDPLTDGTTVGTAVGPVDLIKGTGARLNSSGSRITYTLPTTLTAGEMSLMITGIDEGSPGAKSKVFAMQEGCCDVTTNDYRFTIDFRASNYPDPGAVTYRIITGDASHSIYDGARIVINITDSRWYFWKATWRDGYANVEVREDSATGRVLYSRSVTTNGHPYRPTPHTVHIGSPLARGGELDSSIPGMIAKNLWVSSRPRPSFPTVQ